MILILDRGVPGRIRTFLEGHTVKRTQDMGWDQLTNGELLSAAEAAGFDVLITTDKNIRYQQNLSDRKIAIVVIANAQWPILRLHVDGVVVAVNAAAPGTYVEVKIPGR